MKFLIFFCLSAVLALPSWATNIANNAKTAVSKLSQKASTSATLARQKGIIWAKSIDAQSDSLHFF